MSIIQKGSTAYCIFEKRIKPFEVQVVKVKDVKQSHGFGLVEVELENGIVFKGSNAKSQFLYEDKERSAGAKPTRAQVVIFFDKALAARHLNSRGAAKFLVELDGPKPKAPEAPAKTEAPAVEFVFDDSSDEADVEG